VPRSLGSGTSSNSSSSSPGSGAHHNCTHGLPQGPVSSSQQQPAALDQLLQQLEQGRSDPQAAAAATCGLLQLVSGAGCRRCEGSR
jgi:hypothetical protein